MVQGIFQSLSPQLPVDLEIFIPDSDCLLSCFRAVVREDLIHIFARQVSPSMKWDCFIWINEFGIVHFAIVWSTHLSWEWIGLLSWAIVTANDSMNCHWSCTLLDEIFVVDPIWLDGPVLDKPARSLETSVADADCGCSVDLVIGTVKVIGLLHGGLDGELVVIGALKSTADL